MKTRMLVLAAMAAIGCSKSTKSDSSDRPEAAKPSKPAELAIDERSVLDLALAVAAVEKGDPEDADAGYAEVVSSFKGKRYRWQLYLVPPLCNAQQCNALPFKNAGRDHGIAAGWMPTLELTSADRQRLLAECAGTPKCQFTIEGNLSEFSASTEHFTRLGLDEVKLVAIN